MRLLAKWGGTSWILQSAGIALTGLLVSVSDAVANPKEFDCLIEPAQVVELRSPVDLVRWEDANSILRAEIIRQGTVVYAA